MKIRFETDGDKLDAIAVADILHGIAALGYIFNEVEQGYGKHDIFDDLTYFYPYPRHLSLFYRDRHSDFWGFSGDIGERNFETDHILSVFVRLAANDGGVKITGLQIGSLEAEIEGILRNVGGKIRDLFKKSISSTAKAASKQRDFKTEELRRVIDEVLGEFVGLGLPASTSVHLLINAAISKVADGLARIHVRSASIEE
ncbi:hypothetical protein [Burkholderia sp. WAC0059]|uniref:hypothetical protein n=1 Tax=Burkholderia sp. WAC0059 TaxID=2066022 RepID=UPI0011AF8730|nr:hypothetical protein [Burkholderia sp. WAC0059]